MLSVYKDHSELNKGRKLSDYFYFAGEFTLQEIDKVTTLFDKYEKQDGVIGDGKLDKNYRKSRIAWLPLQDDTAWIYQKLLNCAKSANEKLWNFQIIGFGEKLQLTEYQEGDKYDWHMDMGGLMNHRKISISVQLSHPNTYEGGELEFKLGTKEEAASKSEGSVTLFPSYLLHRVKPITKGKRMSLICWISGESWR